MKPALAGKHAGGIGGPDLIETSDHEVSHAVSCDRSTMAAVGGGVAILGALPGKEAFLAHEPGDAVTPSWTTAGQSRTAISLATAGELLPDAGTQVDGLGLPRPRLTPSLFPVVIAAA